MNKNNDAGGMGTFSKKHEVTRKLAREFAENEIAPMAAQIDETGEYPEELHRKTIGCEFHAIVVPGKYEGCGGGTVSAIIVTEEFTKVNASASMQFMPNSLSGGSLMMFGNGAQRRRYPRGIAGGKLTGVLTITEPGARPDTAAITTAVEADGDYCILNGRECFITNGPRCDFVTALVKTNVNARGVKGISAFAVELTWEGFSRGAVENKMSVYGSPTYGLVFENVRVPRGNLLTSEDQDFEVYMATLDSGRIAITAQDFGIAQGALDEAVKYVRERIQFGRPISKFQNTQSEIADMATKMECGGQLVYHAAELRDARKPYSKNATMVKYYRDDLCNNIAYCSPQLHGGYDYTKDYLVERMFHDAGLAAIYEGIPEVQRMVIANHVLGK